MRSTGGKLMPKTDTFQDLVLGERKGNQELWRWLYTELRSAILDGRLKAGTRLPSTRSLADQYALSRGTVVAAFNQLRGEGYVSSEVSAGTFVASAPVSQEDSPRKWKVSGRVASRATLGKHTKGLFHPSFVLPSSRCIGMAFRSYEPAIDLFPVELWARVAARVYRNAPRSLYGQGHPAGYLPLRRAIAEYVGRSRGVRCTAEQVIVTSGAQQALDLLARLLLDVGDEVWMEDPGYPGASQAFHAARAQVIPVPVDGEGLQVGRGIDLAPHARVAYVTPANQFPLGTVMSAQRRVELLAWAVRSGAWVIEDEYDAEYRYFGKPVASLHSVDRSGSVLYVGTFTKMLFNALRLGFVVLPERLVEAFERARSFMDRHPATLDQAVLAEFISEGHFGNHVRKMRQVYAERLQILSEASASRLAAFLAVENAPAGMRTVAWIKPKLSGRIVAERAAKLGLEVVPVSVFTAKYTQKPALILGFGGCNASEIKRGVSVLETVFRSV
jgi:GntR family transcriptional regulator/MocR family aminotransferase